jgi:hypothetical protein
MYALDTTNLYGLSPFYIYILYFLIVFSSYVALRWKRNTKNFFRRGKHKDDLGGMQS